MSRTTGRAGGGRVARAVFPPLAVDDARAEFWVRHVQVGVALSCVLSLVLLTYAHLTPERPHRGVVIGLALVALTGSPLLLRLPMRAMARDRRGPAFLYTWSVVIVTVITVGAALDGGSASPVVLTYAMTLGFAAGAYPPVGVALVGGLMVLAYGVLAATSDAATAEETLTAAVLVVFVLMCVWSSRNHWDAQEVQQRLSRTHQLLAATDPLTGCLNRRAFIERLEAAGTRSGDGPGAALFVVDLDGFKRVNDRAGHSAGDAVLRGVVAAVGAVLRGGDVLARLGGDEFAVMARITNPAEARELAARIRGAVAVDHRAGGVTASVGWTLVGRGESAGSALHRADLAMYAAKVAGGDREAAGTLLADPA